MHTIQLRLWQLEDLDNLVRYANNKKIFDNLRDVFPHPYTEADGRHFIEVNAADNPTKVFAIEVDGQAVGSIGIFPQTDIHRKNAEIGYWLGEPFWGKGIVTEAVRRIIDYGFSTFDITRIYAIPFPTNIGSQRVLTKAGLHFEARLEKALFKNGQYVDELIYSIRK
jgi:RimJ/RimL family protein N-acetyltransferase